MTWMLLGDVDCLNPEDLLGDPVGSTTACCLENSYGEINYWSDSINVRII